MYVYTGATLYHDVLLLLLLLLFLLLLLLLDVVPDILTIGKPMGNGFPVSGLVTTPTVDTLHAKKAPSHYSSVSLWPALICACAHQRITAYSGVEAEKSALELHICTYVRMSVHTLLSQVHVCSVCLF